MQKTFNPADYNFKWIDDGTEYGWYEWDRAAAHKAALKDRNAEAKRLQKKGYTVKKFSLSNQMITRGGIGSGKPEIDMLVNCYGFNAEHVCERCATNVDGYCSKGQRSVDNTTCCTAKV